MGGTPDHIVQSQPWQLAELLQRWAFGLIAADQQRGAFASAMVRAAAGGLGLITLTTRKRSVDDAAPEYNTASVTLLLLGPVGDDHGQVIGTVRALGARPGQVIAMHRPHDADVILVVRLNARDKGGALAVWADPFTPHKLGVYCALLRGQPFDPDLRLEACTGLSFFSRRATARQVVTTNQA